MGIRRLYTLFGSGFFMSDQCPCPSPICMTYTLIILRIAEGPTLTVSWCESLINDVLCIWLSLKYFLKFCRLLKIKMYVDVRRLKCYFTLLIRKILSRNLIWLDLCHFVKQAEAKQVFISQTIFKALIILTLIYETFGSASKILFEKKIG